VPIQVSQSLTAVLPEPATHQPKSRKPKALLYIVTACAAVVFLGMAVVYFVSQMHTWVKTDNAYLAAHIHTISSRVAGTVSEVLVTENQTVPAGSVLARLDPLELEVRRDQALAQWSAAKAQVAEAAARVTQAHAQIAREQARAVKAQNDLGRAVALFEGGSGAISRQDLDLARSESEAAKAALKGAESALESANASTAAARAQEQAASASVAEAALQLSYTKILAPAGGRIGRKNLEVGNRIQPGQPILALVQPEIWVNANFKETQLAHIRPGQAVRIQVDAFPGIRLRGTVESISPASGAEFALLPPDNATGNFTKIVQRVPVKILIDPASLGACAGRLAAGMSALVEVRVQD
jgi:membrane fusion protein (multidrug efflux system)